MAGGTEYQDTDPAGGLLAEGVRSYVPAMISLREFRREVQKTSRKVLKLRLPELVRSIGLGIEPEQMSVREYANPEDLVKWGGTSAWVAARFWSPDEFEGYLGLHWRESDSEAGVVATLVFLKREVRERLRLAVTSSGAGNLIETHSTEISLWEPLSVNDAQHLGERLDKLINDWIRVWSDAGGLKGLMGPASTGR